MIQNYKNYIRGISRYQVDEEMKVKILWRRVLLKAGPRPKAHDGPVLIFHNFFCSAVNPRACTYIHTYIPTYLPTYLLRIVCGFFNVSQLFATRVVRRDLQLIVLIQEVLEV